MTAEALETIILGHIAKELKDEIQIERQVNLAKTIMQALRIHDAVRQNEQLSCPCCADGRDEFEPDWKCPDCRQKDEAT